jgi:hypothetical protein
MDVTDLIVEVRDGSYNRVGQLTPTDLKDLEIVLLFNEVSTWKLSLDSNHPLVDTLIAPKSGIVVTGPSGTIISGPTVSAKNVSSLEYPKGIWEIEGRDDSIILSQTALYPKPTNLDVTLQTTAYDTFIGKAESAIKHYVKANIGADAPVGRKINNLIIEADSLLGNTLTTSARFNPANEFIGKIASTSGLGYKLEQVNDNLVFKVYAPLDLSGTIRMDVYNNQLAKTEYLYKAPLATRIIVGGKGAAEQRTFKEVTTSESLAAEAEWGRRIEVFKDNRSTTDDDELIQAGLEVLVKEGKTLTSVVITPSDYITMRYGFDWNLGDIISVMVNDTEIKQVVTQVGILVNNAGVTLKINVGDQIKTDLESTLIYLQGDHEERLNNLERNTESGATSARQSVVYTSPSLTAGQVYQTSVAIAGGYRLESISTTVPCRVRLYTKDLGQTYDASRPVLSYPHEHSCLIIDYTSYDDLLSVDVTPTVYGWTATGSEDVPLTITNNAGVTTPVQITFIYVKTE